MQTRHVSNGDRNTIMLLCQKRKPLLCGKGLFVTEAAFYSTVDESQDTR